ncbi:hypothetical protein BCE_5403 [Bacillus cereus ATCC 10987]|uniref:Uncharacterized protein n=1 Tax=Bacillus cereus (strain ATCC 10987 / NRS 248) TaxID=222523 RepID=Q72XH4_BACC1|nr:hypothetical protein BCE_5403 [Bacillus cereus ATCC 10987]
MNILPIFFVFLYFSSIFSKNRNKKIKIQKKN